MRKLTAKKKMLKVKTSLIQHYPFLGYIIHKLRIIEIDKEHYEEIETMAVDKFGNLYYNPNFVDSLTEKEVVAICCHEVLHVAFLHLTRAAKNKNKLIWNIAADGVVNYILEQEKVNANTDEQRSLLKLPINCIIPHYETGIFILKVEDSEGKQKEMKVCFKNKSVEEAYAHIVQEMKKNDATKIAKKYKIDEHITGKSNITGKDRYGNHISSNDESRKGPNNQDIITDNESADTDRELANKWRDAINEAKEFSKNKGRAPGYLKKFFDTFKEKQINWKTKLRKIIKPLIPFDYTYSKPHKRGSLIDTYLPSITKSGVKIYILLDTSGSIGREWDYFITECYSILNSHEAVQATIFTVDTKIRDIIELNRRSKKKLSKLEFHGGGGTNFVSAYEEIEKDRKKPKLLIFFTDGETYWPKKKLPNTKTLWVITNRNIKAPFGKTIYLDTTNKRKERYK